MKKNSQKTNRKIWLAAALGWALLILFTQPQTVSGQQWTGPDGNSNISNTNTGNVGIGTTSPTLGKLQVTGMVGNTSAVFGSDGTGVGLIQNWGQIGFNTYFNGTFRAINSGFGGTVGVDQTIGGIFFRTANTVTGAGTTQSQIERMRIDNSGKVGIGTTNPGQKLSVVGTVESTSGGFKFPDGTVQATAAIGGGGVSSAANVSAGQFGANTGGGDFSFPAHIIQENGKVIQAKNAAGSAEAWMWPRWSDDIMYTNFGSSGWNIRNNSSANVMFLTHGGNVGVGTNNPGSKLHVLGGAVEHQWSATNGQGYGFFVSRDNNHFAENAFFDGTTWRAMRDGRASVIQTDTISGYALYVKSDDMARLAGSARAFTIPFVIKTNGNVGIGTTAPTEKLHVEGNGKVTGNLTVDGNIAAKYQDLAEWVESSEYLSAGTVVVLDHTKSNQVISSTQSYDTRVAGVISAQPGIALGESGENKVLVATTGRVRMKVDASRGPIHIGDLLVTSDVPGMAMKSEPVSLSGVQLHRPGTLIGKALEPLENGSGKILVLLSLQ